MVVEQFEFQASSLLTDPSAASAAFEEHGLLVLRGLFVRDHLTDPPASQHIHCVSYAPARRHACASNLMECVWLVQRNASAEPRAHHQFAAYLRTHEGAMVSAALDRQSTGRLAFKLHASRESH